MKVFAVFVFLWFPFVSVQATTYYLSNTGSDANSGTAPQDAWQTIAHLNSISLLPGDSVLFECGGVFRGEIVVSASGTESDPVYFGKYGSGELPVISGAQLLSGWSLFDGNVYSAPYNQPARHLFVNGERMSPARFPNAGFLTQQGGTNNNGFSDSSLTQPENFFRGAVVHLRTSNQRWEINTVDSSLASEIFCVSPFANPVSSGYGYYFDNLLSLLDTAREWAYDPALDSIFLFAPDGSDPSTLQVEVSVFYHGISVQAGYAFITVQDLQFEKQVITGAEVIAGSHHVTISGCRFRLEGERAVLIQDVTYVNCTDNAITDCLAEGIRMISAGHCTISNNSISSIGIVPGLGINAQVNGFALVADQCVGLLVTGNEIESTGNGGISISADSCTLEKNIFSNCFLVMNDAAVITQLPGSHGYNLYDDNIIFPAAGNNIATPGNALIVHGMEASDSCEGCFITHNTIEEVSGNGIYLKSGPALFTVNRNVVYGCGQSQLKLESPDSMLPAPELSISLNQFYALHEDQHTLLMHTPSRHIISGHYDFNYYFNPYDHTAVALLAEDSVGITEYRFTLDQWKEFSGEDADSRSSFFYRNRFTVEDSIGPELITNGQFTSNFDGWNSEIEGNMEFLLDNSTPLDYGCLKLIKSDSIPFREGGVYSSEFAVDSGQTYQVLVSIYSMRDGNLRMYIASNDPPFDGDGLNRYFPFSVARSNYQMVFEAKRNDEHARLQLLINLYDSLAWVDNVSVAPVSATYHAPKKLSRLFTNPTAEEVAFDLGDSVFFNLDQNEVTGVFTLPPYSSAILIFDSSMITFVAETVLRDTVRLFPNPARTGSTVYLETEHDIMNEISGRLFGMLGSVSEISFQKISSRLVSFTVPERFSPGMYLVEMTEGGKKIMAKLLVEK